MTLNETIISFTSSTLRSPWNDLLKEELQRPYMISLTNFLNSEREKGKIIYPKKNEIFAAFEHTHLDQVRVVIIGQDPYHGEGQAHGLSFSVAKNVALPPSLKNIFKQIQNDYPKVKFKNGCLIPWAKQGVFLLNSVLTVEGGKPGSHANKGWEIFTDRLIQELNAQNRPIVFLLWGNYAKLKGGHIDPKKHFILTSPHPSPLSAYQGFLGNEHFKLANEFLEQNGMRPIDWSIH
ncbi:MAG: uracil-DNA glycosylase [Bacteriovoracaceae bacterium]|nr:uracil-DNA glycosylase [Bacteriovoracaceae bacterium]